MITKKDSLYLKVNMNCTGWTLHKMPNSICSLDALSYFMIYANACSIRLLSATLQISSRMTTVQMQFSSRWQQHTFIYLFDAHYTATVLQTPSHQMVLCDHVHSQYPQFTNCRILKFLTFVDPWLRRSLMFNISLGFVLFDPPKPCAPRCLLYCLMR